MLCRSLGVVTLGIGIGISLVACGAGAGSAPREEDQAEPARAGGDARSPLLVGTETFPRVAMLWSSAEDLEGTRAQRMANYNLSVVGVQTLGLRWQRHEDPDLAETFEPATIDAARAMLAEVRAANPCTMVCCEVYFFEARQNAYPADHAWWFRDAKGQKVSFWRGAYNMDVGNAEYIEHIARRILAVHDAVEGKAGIFLDNLRFDPTARRGWTSLMQKLRAARPDIVVLVNSGWSSTNLEWIAPQINGILYEDSVAHTRDHDTEAYYRRVGEHWSLLRNPRISVSEKFGARNDTESLRRELSRTLVYTDAAFIYADSTNGHRHSWRSEFGILLGKPLDPARTPVSGQLARRAFAGGTVVWLPANAPAPVTIELDMPHAPAPGVAPARSFTLSPGSGLILVRTP